MGSLDGMESRKRWLSINTAKKGSGEGTANGELTAAAVPLSPAARLFHQPHFNCYIIAMMGVGKRIDVDAVKAGLEATLIRHPRFSSILVLDKARRKKPKWVQTKVVIENHLIVPDLGSETTGTTPDQVVEDYVSSLSGTTLDPSRPLWELHLLNLRTSESEALGIFRIHHSLGDGISLMSLLLACTRKTSDPNSPPTLPNSRPSNPSPTAAAAGVWALLRWVWASMVLMWHTLVDVLIFVATIAFLRDTETPFTGADGVELHPKRFLHRTLSLDDIKAVKTAMGCTVNDVLVGLTSAGLSRYLSRKYGEKNLLANIRLRTTLLFNIRPTPGIRALAEMMEGGGSTRWGNWLSYVILPFPVGRCEDPLDYIRNGVAIAERKKNSLEAVFTYNCVYLVVKMLGIKAAAALSNRVLRHTTLSFSNIVGPVEEIEFCGHPIVYIAPSVYGHPHALTLHFQSYMNKMKVVLAVDELAIPDPHQLLDDLAESLRLIKDSILTSC